METHFEELQMYQNFDELADDIMKLAKEILPEQLFYLSVFSDTQQFVLKLSNERSNIHITEGMVVNLSNSVCNQIDFEKKQPLIYEDVMKECHIDEIKMILGGINVQSYLGIPISLTNGEKFGTLCAVNDEVSVLDKKSIDLLQRIVKMFSYYLEMERFVWRDILTELYNRRYLTKFFEDHPNKNGALFFLDLDGFKSVNDAFGHDIGDRVLKEVASRLRTIVNEQKNDAFAVRLGGDEFVLNFSQNSSRKEWSILANQLLKYLNTWNTQHKVSASIGIVTYTEGSQYNLETLLKHADTALYYAKSSGKNTYKFFES